jgi:hypothetical protein
MKVTILTYAIEVISIGECYLKILNKRKKSFYVKDLKSSMMLIV